MSPGIRHTPIAIVSTTFSLAIIEPKNKDIESKNKILTLLIALLPKEAAIA
jgi:hypothetical protein